MALLTISGGAASRWEEVAHGAARLLGYELVTESRLAQWMAREFGDTPIPSRLWAAAAVSVLAPIARSHHLVIAVDDGEHLFRPMPSLFSVHFSVHVEAPQSQRIGNLMLDRRLEKAEAEAALTELDRAQKRLRKNRFGKAAAFVPDLSLSLARMDVAGATEVLAAAARARLEHEAVLSPLLADALLFETRLQLARRGIVPIGAAAAARPEIQRIPFGHPSEQMFANVLDFYRIEWQYEPRSFSLQWNQRGEVTEAFTPDFYLPQFDLYIELTTMKQSLVTRKNRKIKLLRAIYPHINIQVFYQKDFQELVSKYGLQLAAS